MNLYHLHREATGWDEQLAVVVRAPDESEARGYAAGASGDEGDYVWLAAQCELLATNVDGPPGIVVRAYRNG